MIASAARAVVNPGARRNTVGRSSGRVTPRKMIPYALLDLFALPATSGDCFPPASRWWP